MTSKEVESREKNRNSKIAEDIIAFRLGWQRFEDSLPESQRQETIDLNVSPIQISTETFYSPENVRNRAEQLLKTLEQNTSLTKTEKEYLTASVRASIAFLTETMSERHELCSYVRDTLGIWPEIFQEDEVRLRKRHVAHDLEMLGYKDNFNSAIVEFIDENLLPKEVVKGRVEDALRKTFSYLSNSLDIQTKDLELKVISWEVDEPWRAWLKGSGASGLQLFVNTHPRARFFEGEDERVGSHEGWHLKQIASWQQSIEEGIITPASGITTLHTPEQISTEGIATIAPILIPDLYPYSSHGRLAVKLNLLEKMVLHNAHLRVNFAPHLGREGIMEKQIDYVCGHLPYFETEEVRDILLRRLNGTLERTYELSYSLGAQLHCELARDVLDNDPELIRALIKAEFERPMTATQIQDEAIRLRNEKLLQTPRSWSQRPPIISQ